jgi:hypothetical protein
VFERSLKRLALLAALAALASSPALAGCGRVQAGGPAAPGVALKAVDESPAPEGGPETLAAAAGQAKRFMGAYGDAKLAYAVFGPLLPDGTPLDSLATHWGLGYWTTEKSGKTRYVVVSLDLRGYGQAATAFGQTSGALRPLAVEQLPSLKAVLGMARKAGLGRQGYYAVEFLQTPSGTQARVTTHKDGEDLARVILAMPSGKPIGPVERLDRPAEAGDAPTQDAAKDGQGDGKTAPPAVVAPEFIR